MKTPLALLAAATLTPIAATTVLSIGMVVSTAAFALARLQRETASVVTGAGDLRSELRLDAHQDTLWTQAEDADFEANGTQFARLRQNYEQTLARLKEPGIDVNALAAQMDEFTAAERALRGQVSERWKALYATLDAGQRLRAGDFFNGRID